MLLPGQPRTVRLTAALPCYVLSCLLPLLLLLVAGFATAASVAPSGASFPSEPFDIWDGYQVYEMAISQPSTSWRLPARLAAWTVYRSTWLITVSDLATPDVLTASWAWNTSWQAAMAAAATWP
jgi:hypothetical protein